MVAPAYRWAAFAFFFVFGCISSCPAQTSTTYHAVVGGGYLNRTYIHSGAYYNCGANGPFYQEVASVNPITLSLLSDLPLVKTNGKWQAASITEQPFTSSNNLNQTFTSTISESGIVTTYQTFGGLYTVGYYWSGTNTEVIDLETGRYTYTDSDDITLAPDASGNCGASIHNSDDDQGSVTVGFYPFTANIVASLGFTNPVATDGSPFPLSANVPPATVPAAPFASALAADGVSAAVIVYQSSSANPVTFTLTAPGGTTGIGGLSGYSPDYLVNPAPGIQTHYTDGAPINGPACTGNQGPNESLPPCIFVDLLYAPASMPGNAYTGGIYSPFLLSVQATQSALNGSQVATAESELILQPPPLVLVHGVWSSAAQAWPPFGSAGSFQTWLGANYPHQLISTADYGAYSSLDFRTPAIQQILALTVANALTTATHQGVVVGKVDVVGHSMGGLVTRYFMDQGVTPVPVIPLPKNPIHKLVTIGTPHDGSALAQVLDQNKSNTQSMPNPLVTIPCTLNGLIGSQCTLSALLSIMGKQVGGATQSLEPNSVALQSLYDTSDYHSIVGLAPPDAGPVYGSGTEQLLTSLIGTFVPGQTDISILGNSSDTIVNAVSQVGSPLEEATVSNIVHTALVSSDTGETASPEVWAQATYWLLGEGTGQAPGVQERTPLGRANTKSFATPASSSSTAPAAVLDLTGYTQVSASNVSFSPIRTLPLTINSTSIITATSSTKTLSEVLLFQTVSDPSDTTLYAVTESPFSIFYTPTRLGTANFTAFAVFTDNTFATLSLNYTLQPSGSALALSLQAPTANLPIGLSTVVPVQAAFTNGPVNVTNAATYASGSGGSNVFSVGTGGSITTTGNGVDRLNVSYGGVSASALISVGSCSYVLSPVNQIVNYGGGSVSIQVTTQSGCSWTAASDSSWLALSQAAGTGSGTISAVAIANASGSAQTAFVTIGNVDVALIQPATACTYAVTPSSLSLPAAGGSGVLAVATTCPTTSSSNATWADVTTLSSNSVAYTVSANTNTQPQSAILTVGTQQVAVVEAGVSAPVLGVSPGSLTFGSQVIGTTSTALPITISNSGTAALTFSSVVVSGDFTHTNTCSSSIATGTNCTISVMFAPTAAGTRTGMVTITDNASGSPQTISLTGTGVAPAAAVTLTPASLTFPSIVVETASAAQIVTLTNSGTAALTISSITGSGDFAVMQSCGSSVATGATCNISVTFTPTDGGNRTGAITIADNAPGSPQTVALSGGGESVSLSATSTSLTVSSPGGSASTPVQVAGVGGFAGTVAITCVLTYQGQGTPIDLPTCSLTPTQVQITNSAPVSSILNVSTTAASASAEHKQSFDRTGFVLAALTFIFWVPRRRWRSGLPLIALCLISLAGAIGCGSSPGNSSSTPANSGTTAGNYQVQVTASTSTVSVSTTLSLTLQ